MTEAHGFLENTKGQRRVVLANSHPQRGGWTRHQEDAAKPPLRERTGWSGTTKHFGMLTTPAAALRWLRRLFLTPQPPLLFQEGSCQGPTPLSNSPKNGGER